MTRFIFCSDYWHPLALDSAYEDEVNAVQKLGLSYSLIDFEKLEQREAARSVCRVEPSDTEEIAIYRGWMLKPRAYEPTLPDSEVARKMDGTWTIVEPGDGQVAGLPPLADKEAFYRALADGLRQ